MAVNTKVLHGAGDTLDVGVETFARLGQLGVVLNPFLSSLHTVEEDGHPDCIPHIHILTRVTSPKGAKTRI